jgi:uncharacterized protein YegP (UPF0339 family)
MPDGANLTGKFEIRAIVDGRVEMRLVAANGEIRAVFT